MNQCSQYNPEQRFQFNNGLMQGHMLPGFNPGDNDSNSHKRGKKRHAKKANTSSESDSDSSEGTYSSKKKKRRSKTSESDKMPFGGFGSGFNPMNMMALGQMMGFNPMTFGKNK